MRTPAVWIIALLLILGSSYPIVAQTDRATLEGTVTDSSGAAIANAKVQIRAVATGQSEEKVTSVYGHYRFPAMAVGLYAVIVSREGFETKQIEDVEVQVGETRTLDVGLTVGAVSEKVVVKAETAPYERSTAASATVIRDDQIGNLPVNGRDWAGLTLLAPFAQDDGGGDQRTIRFAGRARDDNNFNFEGVDAGGIQEQSQKSQTRLQISEDAVEEYRVSSALYDAEYGTQAGGQINVVTKSGTNEFHGTAFGYLRNSAFDARNFNDPAAVAPFRLGQYGLTLGGPLIKEKTFFFIGYEGLRQFQASTSISNVPTAAFLNEVLVTGKSGVGPSPQMCSIMQAYPWRKSTGTVGVRRGFLSRIACSARWLLTSHRPTAAMRRSLRAHFRQLYMKIHGSCGLTTRSAKRPPCTAAPNVTSVWSMRRTVCKIHSTRYGQSITRPTICWRSSIRLRRISSTKRRSTSTASRFTTLNRAFSLIR
jgi:hypothetical protein